MHRNNNDGTAEIPHILFFKAQIERDQGGLDNHLVLATAEDGRQIVIFRAESQDLAQSAMQSFQKLLESFEKCVTASDLQWLAARVAAVSSETEARMAASLNLVAAASRDAVH